MHLTTTVAVRDLYLTDSDDGKLSERRSNVLVALLFPDSNYSFGSEMTECDDYHAVKLSYYTQQPRVWPPLIT